MSSEAAPWPRRAGDVTIEARSEPGVSLCIHSSGNTGE